MDLTGRARGTGTGRGGTGQRPQGPGTMTPCALAVALTSAISTSPKKRHSRSLKVRIPFLLENILREFAPARRPLVSKPAPPWIERLPTDFFRGNEPGTRPSH